MPSLHKRNTPHFQFSFFFQIFRLETRKVLNIIDKQVFNTLVYEILIKYNKSFFYFKDNNIQAY